MNLVLKPQERRTNMSREESIKWLNALLASDKKKPILRTGEICAIKKALEVLQD